MARRGPKGGGGGARGGEEDGWRPYPATETDGMPTATSWQQIDCERTCELSFLPLRPGALDDEDMDEFRKKGMINEEGEPLLMRNKHALYLERGLNGLGPGFISLDASRPWMMYWIMHSLDLLERLPAGKMRDRVVQSVASCQDRNRGGFGGGPQQLPHCAPMYAAVLTLLLIGSPEAYAVIDRHALYRFFMSLKHESGGFRMHNDGEVDARGTYTVIAVASLLNMLTPELSSGVAEFALRCQTYEGGFGGEPWNEAHGGYTFCAFASLVILGQAWRADLDGLRNWLCCRQMKAEGGFQGRTNKLVDGCYSFWQGGALALLDYVAGGREGEVSHRDGEGHLIASHLGGVADPSHAASKRSQRPPPAARPESLPGRASPSSETQGGGGDASGDGNPGDGTGANDGGVGGPGGVVHAGGEGTQVAGATATTAAGQGAAADNDDDVIEELDLTARGHGGGNGSAGAACGRDDLMFARELLQEYVLMCSQQLEGGLRDKPGKSRDFYHTCYTLSGLSVAQHCLTDKPVVTGDPTNELRPTNPAYNVAEDKVVRAMAQFMRAPSDHNSLMGKPS